MRRIFVDRQGNEVGQLDLWNYGYDARSRLWYRDTLASDRPLISSPYLAFSISAPVITISAPLVGKVRGVLAADLKLDSFSGHFFLTWAKERIDEMDATLASLESKSAATAKCKANWTNSCCPPKRRECSESNRTKLPAHASVIHSP